jgi:uncharacterized protein (DUF169 family)
MNHNCELVTSQRRSPVTTFREYNTLGEELEKLSILRTSPLAIKMLQKESDIPEGAIRPKRDRHYHIAQCQAFAM